MPDRDRRRRLMLGFGSFAFAWFLVLMYFVVCQIFNPTRWFAGRHYALRMDAEDLVIWKDLTYWTTISIAPFIFLAFGLSGVLCLSIGISEMVREAAAKRKVDRRGFEVIVPQSVSPASGLVPPLQSAD